MPSENFDKVTHANGQSWDATRANALETRVDDAFASLEGSVVSGDEIPNATADQIPVALSGGGYEPASLPMLVPTWPRFGAVGDGTADDTAEIQAALDAADALGGALVYLPRGIYKVSDTLQLYDGVHLVGAGANFKDTTKGTTIKATTAIANAPILSITDCKDWAVEKLTLVGPTTDPTLNTTIGISDWGGDWGSSPDNTQQATLGRIENVNTRYLGGTCIQLHGNVNTVRRVRFDDRAGHGIHWKNNGGTNVANGTDWRIDEVESGFCAGNGSAPGANGDAVFIEGGGYGCITDLRGYNGRYGAHLKNAAHVRGALMRMEKNDIDGLMIDGGYGHILLGVHSFNNGWVSSKRGGVIKGGAHSCRVQGEFMNIPGTDGGTNTEDGFLVSGSAYDIDLDIKVANTGTYGAKLDTVSNIRGRIQTIETGEEGVYLNVLTDSDLDLNVSAAGRDENNTRDAIAMVGACARNRLRVFARYGSSGNQTRYGLNIGASCTANTINGDLTNSGASGRLNADPTTTGTKISGTLRGYATENSGSTNIANGSTSRTITHAMPFTPTAAEISITPTNNLGNATQLWVSNIGSSSFDVNSDADPGASTATFHWAIKKLT